MSWDWLNTPAVPWKERCMSNDKRAKSNEQRAVEKQITDLTEALQRERADADNIRRRHDEQMASLKNMVKANVVRELLPVIDNFERALRHSPVASSKQQVASKDTKLDEWVKGVMSIKVQFEKTLEQMGVTRIKTIGEAFDPSLHEAVSADGDGHHEVISDELQAGYMVGDNVIRHAMVKIKMQIVPKLSGEEGGTSQ